MKNNAIALGGLWRLVKRLNGDCKRCLKAIDKTPETDLEEKLFWRRVYARAVFALIDVTTYRMTYHAYAASERPGVNFSLAELNRLETAYDFDEELEPVTTFNKTQTLDNIQFAFDAFARVHESAYVLPVHDADWDLVKRIVTFRQALQFCREPEGLEVYNDNMEVLLYGSLWFVERLVDLFESCVDSMTEGATLGELEDNEIVM